MLDHDPAPDSRRPADRRRTVTREALLHVDALYRVAWCLTGHVDDAEALVHATFARAFGGVPEVAAGISLRGRLCRALRDTFATGRPPPGGLEVTAEVDPRLDELVPVDVGRLREVAPGDLQAAVMELPEEDRMVILLDLEGLSQDEIAHALACAAPAVPSRLARARVALRRRLAEVRDGSL